MTDQLYVDVSRSAIIRHLAVSFAEIRMHRDRLLDAAQRSPEDPTNRRHLVNLQRHLVRELRWMRAIAPALDRESLAQVDGRRRGLKRYANEITFLARALKAADDAGPPSASLTQEVYDRLWQRVGTGLTRVLSLGDLLGQL
jgi:hypothetical protein